MAIVVFKKNFMLINIFSLYLVDVHLACYDIVTHPPITVAASFKVLEQVDLASDPGYHDGVEERL